MNTNQYIMRNILLLMFTLLAALAKGQSITLYSDNGQGGIHRSTGRLVVDEGQYYIDLPIAAYNGGSKTERLKVCRVRDHARLLYNQDKWAEKYAYVVERSKSWSQTTPYYFNMTAPWRPSLTEDADNPNKVTPLKKLFVYYDNFQGGKQAMKVVLVKARETLMLYCGDEMFGATVEPNTALPNHAPAWARSYKFRAKISGFDVYFNIN